MRARVTERASATEPTRETRIRRERPSEQDATTVHEGPEPTNLTDNTRTGAEGTERREPATAAKEETTTTAHLHRKSQKPNTGGNPRTQQGATRPHGGTEETGTQTKIHRGIPIFFNNLLEALLRKNPFISRS